MSMSKAGIYNQLTSEHGEKFPAEAAQYAVDNIVFDWKGNALKKAQIYAEKMSMSDSAIYQQLTSEYGEKFTPEEAQYAIDNLK
ncbi:Host cell surface-exposed lipoprotein [Lysinibacillus sp. AC-3]|nr:Host cell surface-exposed lipoprotein [Lysinibacillus sp. AC-3]